MSTTPDHSSFLAELKRRKVVRVAIVYAAVAWVTVQIADVALPAFEAPDWVLRVLIALLVLGLPIALALAWAFDVTPEGLRVTSAAPPAGSGSRTAGSAHGPADDGRTSWMSTRSALAAVLLVAAGAAVGWFASERPGGAERDGPGRAIAVLPFANLAGEDEQYFVDGIHDDILTQLSQLEDLTVISRTSMLRYRETEKGIPEIAAELGVGSVLEGSVQKRGDRVRITAQLIDAGSDAHLWADSFDETLDDYFAIQSRIATEIASALHATLSPAQEARMATAPTENPEALDRYLRGIVYLGRAFGAGDMDLSSEVLLGRAAENLEAAVALDPGYAEAWARLAEAYTELVWFGGGGDEERRRAREAVRAAQAIDPDLPAAAYAEALYAYHGEERYEDALDLLARAERLAPSDPRIYRLRGWVVRRLGRFEEAIAAFDESARLDPLGSEGWQMLDSYLHGRRFDRVIEVARRLGESDASEQSRLATAFWEVAVATQRDGDVGRAERLLTDLVSLERFGRLGDPTTSPLRTWQAGLDGERLAGAAAAVEGLLAGLEASPSSRVVRLGFLAWARNDVLDGEGR
ncbi:MAG TPA: tetratricopeptide repeat protein, partial [Candidatus Limnocylindrales bacterium]|nr:tetratricopeptide repeat protein [Candidatus Limnocylindrales bacterium]